MIHVHLRFWPPSPHSYCNSVGRERTNCLRWACSNACHICSSENTSNGSRFIRSVPENKTGSYRLLKKNTQTFQQSTRLQHFCLIKNQLYEIKGLFLDFIIITESNNYFVITYANIPKTTMQNCFVGNLRWKRSVDHWIRIPSSALVEWLNTYVRPLCVKNPFSVKAIICKKANISTFRYLAFIMLCV